MTRVRAASIVFRDDQLLLMRRQRDGQEYYVVPGGGVEAGESPAEACRRELTEETSLTAISLRPISSDSQGEDRTDYFVVQASDGTPQIGGPEADRNSPTNSYQLRWVGLDELASLPIVPPGAVAAITAAVESRPSEATPPPR